MASPLLALVACHGPEPADDGDRAPVHSAGPEPPVALVTHAPLPDALLARRFEVSLEPTSGAVLRCADGAAEDHVLPVDGGGTIDLWGLLADTAYDCELRWPDEDGAALWSGGFRTGPLPDGLPALRASVRTEPSLLDQGYVLVTFWRQVEDADNVVHLVVLDGEGRIRWFRVLSGTEGVGVAADWVGDALLVGGGAVLPPSLLDLEGRVLATSAAPVLPGEGWHHEAKRTPEGWLLGLQEVPLIGQIHGFRVDVTDPATGDLAWSLDSAPLVLDGSLPPPEPDKDDPYHANAASWVEDLWGPSVWLSLRGVRRIVRVDRQTKAITHQLGPGLGVRYVDPQGSALPEEDGFYVTHDPEITGDRLLVFDNGGDRPGGGETRISRYRILGDDLLEREWTWTEPGWFEPSYGSVQTLPDGTVLVGSGHDAAKPVTGGTSRHAFVLQLDGPAGRVIRRLDFTVPQDSIYRARFVDGCAIFADRARCPAPPGAR